MAGHGVHGSSGTPASKLQHYTIHEVLGKGGFGVVHRATVLHSSQQVAIKMINKRAMKEARMTSRVANEVELHWQLKHPSILELYDYFEDAELVYLVMEYCPNGELYRYVQRRGALPEPSARGVLRELAQGLCYLHANGIIHRDIKLSNLLLSEAFHVKIGDFGLAVMLSGPESEQKTLCGTPNYLSPEVVSRLPYGLATDAWAFGVIMYTLLVGSPPFESKAVKHTLDRVSRVQYTMPPTLSVAAQDLIHSLLQKEPGRRPRLDAVLAHPFFARDAPVRPLSPIRAPLQTLGRLQPDGPRPSQVSSPPPPGPKSHAPMHAPVVENKENAAPAGTVSEPRKAQPLAQPNAVRAVPSHPRNPSVTGSASLWQGKQLPYRTDRPIESLPQTAGTPLAHATLQSQHSRHSLQPPRPAPPSGLEPISLLRLKPIAQQTKHGTIEITDAPALVMDFIGDPYVMCVSADGDQISLYPRAARGPGQEPTGEPAMTYSQAWLPTEYHKKYKYGSRFVGLVRCKTPKLIFYSPQAKCTMFEDAAADFQVQFSDGTKAKYAPARHTVQISRPGGEARQGDLQVFDTRLPYPPSLMALVKHCEDCYARCREIERECEQQDPHGLEYPVVVKSNSSRVHPAGLAGGPESVSMVGTVSRNPSSVHMSASSRASVGAGGRAALSAAGGGRCASAPGIPAPPSELHASTSASPPMPPPVRPLGRSRSVQELPRAMAGPSMTSRPIQSAAPSRQKGRPDDPTAPAPTPAPPSKVASHKGSVVSACIAGNALVKCKFLPDVGWCVGGGEGRFILLFVDGVSMVVWVKEQALEYANGQGPATRYPIDVHLPQAVKAKLTHFPKFLKLL